MDTRNVFLDTQSILQLGLKFEDKALSRLKMLGQANSVNILISEVVKREVTKKLKEKTSAIRRDIESLSRKLKIYESGTPRELEAALSDNEKYQLDDLAQSRWLTYLEESKAIILDIDNINNSDLIELYFEQNHPFSESKKHEFPDAISMLSLREWIRESGEKVYVISGDGDIKGFCEGDENCISLENVSEFLDLYNRAEEQLTSTIHDLVDKETDWIVKVVAEAFQNCGFSYDGNYEAEVDKVEVESVQVQEVEVIDVDENMATVDLLTNIRCTANIYGPNYENAIWDSEEKEYIFIDHFSENMEFEDAYTITIDISVDESKKEISEISNIYFNGGDDITLYFDDGFPYK